MNYDFKDFVTFRRMMAPILLQILFWFLMVLNIVGSIYLMTRGGSFIALGFVNLIIQTLVIRVIFELLIIFFRMNETLTEIKKNTNPYGSFAPPVPAYAPAGGMAPANQVVGAQTLAAQPRQKTCSNCGASVDPSLSFCNKCGQALT